MTKYNQLITTVLKHINILLSILLIISLAAYRDTIETNKMIAPNSEYQVPGPAIDSRAPEPTQLVPGMNGPARGLELVPGPDQPVHLRPARKP